MLRPNLSRHVSAVFSLCLTLVTASACEDDDVGSTGDEPKKLFEESGVWSLTTLDFGGGNGRQDLGPTAKDAFLINFDPGKHVVAAASCAADFDGIDHPLKTKCRHEDDGDSRFWNCSCYQYNIGQKSMMWKAIDDPDDRYASDGEDGSEADESGEESDTGNAEGDDIIIEGPKLDPDDDDVTVVQLKNTGTENLKLFAPLPGPGKPGEFDGLFRSDGVKSSFEFVHRAAGIFDESKCAEYCGID